jgi:aminopeptidase N
MQSLLILGASAAALLLAPHVGAALLQGAKGNTSGGELLPEEAAYDVRHYDLDLELDPDERRIEGSLLMVATLLEETEAIVFDLDERLEIRRLELEGARIDFTRGERQRVRVPVAGVEVGNDFRLLVEYGGQPRTAPNPPWDGGFSWSRTEGGAHWIATSCQGEGADLWWPVKDHPSDEANTMDLRFSVPEGLQAISNGRLVGEEPAAREGYRRFHWRVSTPINSYGVALNVAPYVRLEHDYESVTGETFPFYFWVLPENLEAGREILPEFADHVRFHEELLGPYPFRADKYGVVETPHLGMEHQSIIAYGNKFRGDPSFDYDWLHHHELSHEWWANLVTARDWNDFWIHEGIGTYMQPLYLEQRFGREAYDRKMAQDRSRIANRGALAPRDPKPTGWMYFASSSSESPGGDIYFKGSWVCHTLRWRLGDEVFFEVLRRWAYPSEAAETTTDGSACRFATTDELLAIAEEVSGVELDAFFEVYLRRAALPTLVVERKGGRLSLRWDADGLEFAMPVELELDGERRRVDVGSAALELEVGDAEVLVDPDSWLLCDLRD